MALNLEGATMSTSQQTPRIGAWQAMMLFVLLWVAVMVVGQAIRTVLQPHVSLGTPHEIVAFRMAVGLPLSWLALGCTVLLLRLRGLRLSDIGWGRRGAIWGWLLAALVVAFSAYGSFRGPHCPGMCFIDPHQWLTDWSPFRIATGVAIGITAGVCEEVMFRDFVMSQAKEGGAPVWLQVLLSGVLFGLAHFQIGGMSGHFDPASAIGATISTTIFGCVFALVYLAARRSLTPGVAGHGLFAFITEPWMLLFVIGSAHWHV